MSSEAALYITRYGYLAIFLFVLLQESGVPNPVTNEFVLLFSGYLAFSGVLNLWLAFLAAVSADCIGTTILYALFYLFGEYIMDHRPRWLPVSPARIDRISRTISERQPWGIYVGRHVPFLRGYISVAAGILGVLAGLQDQRRDRTGPPGPVRTARRSPPVSGHRRLAHGGVRGG